MSRVFKQHQQVNSGRKKMYDSGKFSPFKLHYQYREYFFNPDDLKCARPIFSNQKDILNIRSNMGVVTLCLTFFVNIGLSSRETRDILLKVFNIEISHQTVINYVNKTASILADFVDRNCPLPLGITACDENYIEVENRMQYTWFAIDAETRAICL